MGRIAVSVVVCALLAPASARSALVADYQFQSDLTSDVGGAPDLTSVGPGSNAFASETVDSQSRTVLTFPQGNGVAMNTTGLITATYTLQAVFRFDAVDQYRRIFQFKNGASDEGLYNYFSDMVFFDEDYGAADAIFADTYHSIVLTRDGITEAVVGYVDGVEQISFSDGDEDGVIDASNLLLLFDDDGNAEESSGAIACLRVYDTALSGEEVAALPPCDSAAASVVEVPAMGGAGVAILMALLGLAGVASLRTARAPRPSGSRRRSW